MIHSRTRTLGFPWAGGVCAVGHKSKSIHESLTTRQKHTTRCCLQLEYIGVLPITWMLNPLQHAVKDQRTQCSKFYWIKFVRHLFYVRDYVLLHVCVWCSLSWIWFIGSCKFNSRTIVMFEGKEQSVKAKLLFVSLSLNTISRGNLRSLKRPKRIIYLLLFTLHRENCLMNVFNVCWYFAKGSEPMPGYLLV